MPVYTVTIPLDTRRTCPTCWKDYRPGVRNPSSDSIVLQPFCCRDDAATAARRGEVQLKRIGTYLIGQAGTTHVKVGRSDEVFKRIKTFQTGNAFKLHIKQVIDGDHEAALHKEWDRWRLEDAGDEWFQGVPEIIDYFERYGMSAEEWLQLLELGDDAWKAWMDEKAAE